MTGDSNADKAGYLLMLCGFCGAILIQAALYGGNRGWVVYLFSTMMLVLLALALALSARRQADRRFFRYGLVPLTVLLGWTLYPALQLVSLPAGLVKELSGEAWNWWSDSVDSNSYPLTVDPGATRQYLAMALANFSAFVVAGCLFLHRTTRKPVVYLLLLCAVIQAAVGTGLRLGGIEIFDSLSLDGHFDRARGSFINSNHFGAYLVSGLCLAYCLLVLPLGGKQYANREPEQSKFKGFFRAIVFRLSEPACLVGWASIMLMLIGLSLSGSRGAALSLVVALLAAHLLAGRGDRGAGSRFALVLVPVVAAFAWLNATPEFRFESLSPADLLGERIPQWQMTVSAIREYLLTGSGGGTYLWSFAAFRTGGLRLLLYDHAHNDYLEVLLELGLAGLLAGLVFVLIVLFRLIRSVRRTRRGFRVRICLATIIALIAVSVQSSVDFPMQIPALSAQLSAMLGIGLASSISLDHRAKQSIS